MKTVLQTGPGFYAADTNKTNPEIPAGVMRICCARLEAYDIESESDIDMDTKFELLVAKAEDSKEVAKMLLALLTSLRGNEEELRRMAG